MTHNYTRKVDGRTIHMTQSEAIEFRILQYLDTGYDERTEIYDHVVEDLKVPRPTVRRVARDLVIKLKKKVEILTPPVKDPKPEPVSVE